MEKEQPKTPYPTEETINQLSMLEGLRLRFGLVSDTHFGSKKIRLPELQQTYETFNRLGINRVYHAGDLTNGIKVYQGQEWETSHWGFNAQAELVIAEYPELKQGKTYYIAGNHDNSFIKHEGAIIGRVIADRRRDLVYFGEVEADIKMARGVILRLRHPADGSAYALSYKNQKYIESLQGGHKPNILATGHFHQAFFFDYRNILAFQVPCFEDQSLYLKAKGLMPTIGAWVVDCLLDRKGSIIGCSPTLLKYF